MPGTQAIRHVALEDHPHEHTEWTKQINAAEASHRSYLLQLGHTMLCLVLCACHRASVYTCTPLQANYGEPELALESGGKAQARGCVVGTEELECWRSLAKSRENTHDVAVGRVKIVCDSDIRMDD
jgi:hypothetical protein